MASGLADPLRRLSRKLILAVWLGRLARQGGAVLALAGCAILVARAGFDVPTERALWLLLPLAAVPFTAWSGVRARVPSQAGAVAWLDLRSGAEGHLLTEYELGDGRWSGPRARQLERLPELPAMRVGSFARPFLPALAFAALALLVPLTRAESGPSTRFFERAIAGLTEQLKTLTDVAGLEDKLQEELTQRVEDLERNLDAKKPEAMLEAIDSLRTDLEKEGQGAAEMAQELFKRLGHSENQAGRNTSFAQTLLTSGLQQMLKSGLSGDLGARLQQLAPELAKHLDGTELKLPEGFELNPEMIAALSKLLRDGLRTDLSNLSLAQLIDLEGLDLAAGPASLAKLIEKFHKHDESCKKPGGT